MADREKVITHFNDAIEASGNNNKWRFVRVDVINDALELLKEQEPVKPAIGGDQSVDGCWWYICPNCRTAIDVKDLYCRYCGKAMRWDGNEH